MVHLDFGVDLVAIFLGHLHQLEGIVKDGSGNETTWHSGLSEVAELVLLKVTIGDVLAKFEGLLPTLPRVLLVLPEIFVLRNGSARTVKFLERNLLTSELHDIL